MLDSGRRRSSEDRFDPRETGVPPAGSPDDAAEITLYDVWAVIVSQKWLVLIFTGVVIAAATAYALVTPRIYRATVVMVPAQEDGGTASRLTQQLGGLASMIGVPGIDNSGSRYDQTDIALATLNSRAFTDSFLQETGALEQLTQDIDQSTSPQWQAYKQFDASIRHIDIDNKQGVIRLSIDWREPDRAALWANELVTRLNKHMQQAAIQEAEKSIAYLRAQLESTSVVELRQSIFHLIEVQINKIMLANVNDQYAFKVIDAAKTPEEPIAPRRRLIVLSGAVLGLMLGCFAAFIRHSLVTRRQGPG